jgi:hypothetical protein
VPGKLNLKGAKGDAHTLKVTISLERKRAAAKRAAEGGMDLATWVRLVLYRELDDPRPK